MQALRHFLLAVQFFSRLPVTGKLAAWVGWSPEMQRASAAHLPGVGWLVGAATAAMLLAMTWLFAPSPWMPLLAALVATAFGIWLTGAFHEDGLADVADGLGGYLPAERALEVMKDSRLGAYGAMALLLALLLKVLLLAVLIAIEPHLAALLLGCVQVLSRGTPLALMHALPHVSRPATAKTLHIAGQPMRLSARLAAALWCLPAIGLLAWALPGAVLAGMLAAAALITWRLGAWFRRRLGGMTGDCLGATQQLSELAMYLVAAALLLRF